MTKNEKELYDALELLVEYSTLVVPYLYTSGYPGKSKILANKIGGALKVMERFTTVKKPNFVIAPVNNSEFNYVVFSTNSTSLNEYLTQIIQSLQDRNVNYALVDLMCQDTVTENNRFFELRVEPFRLSSIEINESMLDYCNVWYQKNLEWLEDSNTIQQKLCLFLRNDIVG
jgi:hypothetical protein